MPPDSDADGSTSARPQQGANRVEQISVETMLERLESATDINFAVRQNAYERLVLNADARLRELDFFRLLGEYHDTLSKDLIFGKIRSLEAWADGQQQFLVVGKPWASIVDKMYRMNIEENSRRGDRADGATAQSSPAPPALKTVTQEAERDETEPDVAWVTPENVYMYADDILRTKFVTPFADDVVKISDHICEIADQEGIPRYRRYHAKDSGYHARHLYFLIDVVGLSSDTMHVALEVKVLTKMQDTLGELTHRLYEDHRTGLSHAPIKRKLAWLFEELDFDAAYIGHSGHYLEACIARMKMSIEKLESGDSGQS